MSGLEAVEISLSGLERTKRIDSEFYKKENLIVLDVLERMEHTLLTDSFTVSDGNHMSISSDFRLDGIRYYRGSDIYNFFIEDASPIFISEKTFILQTMKRSHLKKDDVLMSIVGAIIGNIALVTTEAKQTCSCKLAIFRPRAGVESAVAAVYLKTRYAQNQIQKFRRGAAQTGFLLEDADQIVMPAFSEVFSIAITERIGKMKEMVQKANATYSTAESLLLIALDMDSLIPSSEPVAIKTFSESFGASGRLDAEYYQQKYEGMENHLNTSHTVKTLCRVHECKFAPHNDDYMYIELANIGNAGNITGCTTAPFDELPSRARRLVTEGQVIVSSIEGSLASCALITDEYDGAICSTGFHVVNSSMINAETLLVLFRSAPMQLLMKKRCSGTILSAISKTAFEEMPLPFIDTKLQQQVADEVQQSFLHRRRSEQLLDTAKRAVEIAIEKGESTALAWLEEAGTEDNVVTLKSRDYYDQRFKLWQQNQGLAARGDIDRQTLREIFDAMDDDDK